MTSFDGGGAPLSSLDIRIGTIDARREIGLLKNELRELKLEAREAQGLLSGLGAAGGAGAIGGIGGVGGLGAAGAGFTAAGAFGGASVPGGGFGPGIAPLPVPGAVPGGPQGGGAPVGRRVGFSPFVANARGGLAGLGFGSTARLLGVGGLAFGGAFAIREAISSFREFEDAQARIISLSGRTEAQLDRLFGSIREAALQTRFSVTEANESAEILLRSGLSPEQTAAAVNPALRFSQAEATGIGTATDVATTALVVFRQEAGDLPDIFNQIAVGASSAKTNVEEIGQALSFAGGTAAAAQADLAETVSLISALAGQGVRGTRAGTALRGFFTAFGDEVRAAGGDATSVLADLGRQGVGINELVGIPGIGRRFATPIAGLIGRIGEVQNLEGAIRSAPGEDVVGRRFEIQSETLGASFDRLGAAVESLVNELLDDSLALRLLQGTADAVTDLANGSSGSGRSNSQSGRRSRQGQTTRFLFGSQAQAPEVNPFDLADQGIVNGLLSQGDLFTLANGLSRLSEQAAQGRDGLLSEFFPDRTPSLQDIRDIRGILSPQQRSDVDVLIEAGQIRPGILASATTGFDAGLSGQFSALGDQPISLSQAAELITRALIERQGVVGPSVPPGVQLEQGGASLPEFLAGPGGDFVGPVIGGQEGLIRRVDRQRGFAREIRSGLRSNLRSTLDLGVRQAGAPGVQGRAIGLTEAFGLDSTNPDILGETVDQLERIQDLDRLRGSIDSLSDGFRGFFNVLRQGGDAGDALASLLDSLTNAALNQFVFGQGALLGPGGPVLGGLFGAIGSSLATPGAVPAPTGNSGFFGNIGDTFRTGQLPQASSLTINNIQTINAGSGERRLASRVGNSARQGATAGVARLRLG